MINQTISNLRSVWQQLSISKIGGAKSGQLRLQAELENGDVDLLRDHMHQCLQAKGGAVSARSQAAKLGEAYLGLNDVGRLRFLSVLAEDFCVDAQKIRELAEGLSSTDAEQTPHDLHRQLRRALRPSSLELLKQFNSLPSGVKFLVDMRADLLRLASRDDTALQELNKNIKSLLSSWFDVGFLDLIRMSWSTPAALLEKLINYEAVHAIQSWSDLKNRLQSDRRCFAFFHPRMPDEPLIFVQVALVNNLSSSIQELLDEDAPLLEPSNANTAIFYSISNAQMGLAGVGFGDFLIKRVVADLRAELPNISTFSTLSPIPGFLTWLASIEEADELSKNELDELRKIDGFTSFKELLASDEWHKNESLATVVKEPLLRLAAHYLANIKRKNRAQDPVANFHLNNGARLERLNWLADTSAKGMAESAGMMVNYLYKLDDIESNHEVYRLTAQTVMSNAIKSQLDKR